MGKLFGGSSSKSENKSYDYIKSNYDNYVGAGNKSVNALEALLGLDNSGGAGSVNWDKYVNSQPDVLANWNTVRGTPADTFGGDIEKFGQYHYGLAGSRGDNRDLSPFTAGPGTETPQMEAFRNFRDLSGYKTVFEEGRKAVENSYANRGLANSGAALKKLTNYGSEMGAAYVNDYLGKLLNLSGVGIQGGGLVAQAGQTSKSSSKAGLGPLVQGLGSVFQGAGAG